MNISTVIHFFGETFPCNLWTTDFSFTMCIRSLYPVFLVVIVVVFAVLVLFFITSETSGGFQIA